jgi:hypothetical protein
MNMPSLDEAFSNLANAVIESRRTAYTAIMINGAAILEYDLERAIACHTWAWT